MIVFNVIEQKNEYKNIEIYCTKFQFLYQDIVVEMIEYITNFFLNDFKSIIQFIVRDQITFMKQLNFFFELNQIISSTLKFKIVNVKRFINNNKNIENIFAININNAFAAQNIFFNYIQSDSANQKKRERDKNDVETSSKNRKCYNCDSIEYLSNECFNFYVSEHAFVD